MDKIIKQDQNLYKKSILWHPWLGCKKISTGCKNCFVKMPNFRVCNDFSYLKKAKDGDIITTALWSDFFIEDADQYREAIWQHIKEHQNLIYLIITKRVERIIDCLPADWGNGYENVILSVTIENQEMADYRLPIFKKVKAKHKWLSAAPLLEDIDLKTVLLADKIEHIETTGEKINRFPDIARKCKYDWFKSLSDQCKEANVRFSIMSCGSKFEYNNQTYCDNSACYRSDLANSLHLNNYIPIEFSLSFGKVKY